MSVQSLLGVRDCIEFDKINQHLFLQVVTFIQTQRLKSRLKPAFMMSQFLLVLYQALVTNSS